MNAKVAEPETLLDSSTGAGSDEPGELKSVVQGGQGDDADAATVQRAQDGVSALSGRPYILNRTRSHDPVSLVRARRVYW